MNMLQLQGDPSALDPDTVFRDATFKARNPHFFFRPWISQAREASVSWLSDVGFWLRESLVCCLIHDLLQWKPQKPKSDYLNFS